MIRWPWSKPVAPAPPPKPVISDGLTRALYRASADQMPFYPIQPPKLAPGVVPAGVQAPVLAMDSPLWNYSQSAFQNISGFPGYPYLSELATRAEYRAFASSISTEITREWITITSSETAGHATKQKVTELTKEIENIKLQQVIQKMFEHDAYFGRGQMFIDIRGQDRSLPLILSPKTIAKNSFIGVSAVEAVWTTPSTYNTLDPAAKDFFRPSKWFMLGQEVHSQRLFTLITRPVPDLLKAAFNFGGISLSQLTEPYVNNWLRTRQSISDLINNFSVTALQTDMAQVLQGSDDGANVFKRAELFTATRSNKGLMLLDKENEQLVQVNVPLGGLSELQAQSQEQMCSVSKTPATILLGVAPTGFGNVSEGEMSCWENWISANQEAYARDPIHIVLQLLQLSMYGEIDPDITFQFDSLRQMTEKELAEIRKANADTSTAYVAVGAVAPDEIREMIARDPASGYHGLDLDREIEEPNEEDPDSTDDDNDKPGDGSGKPEGRKG